MARISKEPEERKQEILHAAITVFSEKGYDKTKMSDIADKIGVAQGLCYRYFSSKEVLFESAIEQYAMLLTLPMQKVIRDNSLTIKQKLSYLPVFLELEKQEKDYYKVFHSENNKKMHDQLSLKICEMMYPYAVEAIITANEKGETHITDYETVASFGVYGQLGILLNDKLEGKEKGKRILAFLNFIL